MAISSSGPNPYAGRKLTAAATAKPAQTARIRRGAAIQSLKHPINGPASNRVNVPSASSRPNCSGEIPRDVKNIGQNGEAEPNAAYIAP